VSCVGNARQAAACAAGLWLLLLAIALAFRGLDLHNSPFKFWPAVRLPQFLLGCVLGRSHALGHFEPLRGSGAAAWLAPLSLAGLVVCAAAPPPFAESLVYPFYV